ncbi:3-deoxy-manno-octulosonate cytidylyltransferase [Kingella potus]|uniref:3-deoxy-manno-octulosonate cytidylyltransferase n=1 Tax=Kingella potus TaxID=265175 RepID=A0A377QYT3_9NEIS|nr:3-deoxy-manno-octulosonate cytidylyltransferase [Kingella potus]UOP01734.1 3-deoxy-manno-octulosonate cytidylyltransferase [Kingella potus]STQ99955.1 3-deoxy-manno-octulosonate cytidylyltransferase [Kingella potus]
MSFTVIIPARLSSTRLPRKALADIGGKPMVVRVAEQAAKSRAGRIVVATDSDEIQAACQSCGIEAVLTSAQHESGTTRLAEAAQILGLDPAAAVVNVQGDEPLISPELIDLTAAALAAGTAPMATAAHPIRDFDEFANPNAVKVVADAQNRALYFSRAPIPYPRDTMRQNLRTLPSPPPLRHIGLYAYRVGFLQEYAALPPSPLEHTESLEQLRVLGHGLPIALVITDTAPAPGVDTQEDLDRVRRLFQMG